MLRFAEVRGGVLVRRRVAARRVAALEAHAKVKPCTTHLHAILALVLAHLRDLDRIHVTALLRHRAPLLESVLYPKPGRTTELGKPANKPARVPECRTCIWSTGPTSFSVRFMERRAASRTDVKSVRRARYFDPFRACCSTPTSRT